MQRAMALLFVLLGISFNSFSQIKYLKIEGEKFPNSLIEGNTSVRSTAFAPKSVSDLGGFKDLLSYVTPSPDQEDAGTCLYMSMTGIAEWWLHRLNGVTSFVPDGNFDLSERWWVNLSRWSDHNEPVNNPYTDTILMFNTSEGALNRDYRFAKGWYKTVKEDLVAAPPRSPGAIYDTGYNWIDDSDKVKSKLVRLPKFSKKVLFADKEENPWAIGVAPEDIVETVKAALLNAKAPVQVVYNHEGYWHSVFVLGFDDQAQIGQCPFIQESLQEFQKEADASSKRAMEASEPTERASQLKRQKKYLRYKSELAESFQSRGGCRGRGAFYVRDSQYSDPSEPVYRYDLADRSGDRPYSKRIILREYEWMSTMANHVTLITAQQRGSSSASH